jgi:hypothetical protein
MGEGGPRPQYCYLPDGYCELERHCSGDTIVREQVACLSNGAAGSSTSGTCGDGPAQTVMIPCAQGLHCSAGLCLTHAAPPTKTCVAGTDCGLPPSTCAERDLVIFTNPSCQDGQCHWNEIVEACGGASPGCDAASGHCLNPPFMQTAVGPPPNPMPDPQQPAPPPAQSCSKAADCVAPAPTCYRASTVAYVNPACEAGSCVFALDISECPYPNHACVAGVCQ